MAAGVAIPGFGSDGSIMPATATVPVVLADGFIFTMNGTGYRLLKYLGGGTYGKVWAAQIPTGEVRTIKFIQCTEPEDFEAAKNEALVGTLVHRQQPSVCSAVYGVGTITERVGTPEAINYFVLVGDRYSETVADYLERELPRRGPQLIIDVLYGLYRTWRSVNSHGTRFNHGDSKLDNYMIFSTHIRMIDMGFGHFEAPGLNIVASTRYNSNNNDVPRDLLHNLFDIYLYYPEYLDERLKYLAYINLVTLPKGPGGEWKWADTYDYLNNPANHDQIEFTTRELISYLVEKTSTASASAASPKTPSYNGEVNSHSSNIAAAAAESDTEAVRALLAKMPPPVPEELRKARDRARAHPASMASYVEKYLGMPKGGRRRRTKRKTRRSKTRSRK